MIFRLVLTLIFTSSSLVWSQVKDQGELVFENQLFEKDSNASTHDYNHSLKAGYQVKVKKDQYLMKAKAFARQDFNDKDRDQAVLEELWLAKKWDNFLIKAGYQILNWTATEAFHPVDGINSRNFDSDAQNAEKLGELTLNLKWSYDAGSFELLLMPRFEAPLFPPSNSRLGFSVSGTTLQAPQWLDKNGDATQSADVNQYGIVWNHSFESKDISLHFLDHIDRNHSAMGYLDTGDLTKITPFYFRTKQYGLTYQQALGSWLVKLEAAYFDFEEYQNKYTLIAGSPEDHAEVAPGLEYSTSFTSGSELTALLEYQKYYWTDQTYKKSYFFQDDLLIGFRYALNDEAGSEIFTSIIIDLAGRDEQFYNLDYSRRIGNFWKIKTGIRYIAAKSNSTQPQGLEQLDKSDRLYFNLTRYF